MSGDTQDSYWVGFDLGGTKMLAVLFDQEFRPVARQRKRTHGQAGPEAGVARIITVIQALLGEAHVSPAQVRGIGVGCPGPLDLDRGIVLEMPNLGWKKVRLQEALESAFGCPTVLANDVDAGVYGEYRFGGRERHAVLSGCFLGRASAAARYTKARFCAAGAVLAWKSGISLFFGMALFAVAVVAGASRQSQGGWRSRRRYPRRLFAAKLRM
jgi:glucokinase